MGRQLQLATTRIDETALLRFIGSLAPIRIFRSSGATQDELWIPDYESVGVLPQVIYIWPQTFPWTPIYKQTDGPKCPPESAGLFYIANSHTAPILELSRSDLPQRRHGRIYWSSDFAAPDGLDYDTAAFTRFVDSVWRWIRKSGKRISGGAFSPYYLPDALSISVKPETPDPA